jgi:hypothetical protein
MVNQANRILVFLVVVALSCALTACAGQTHDPELLNDPNFDHFDSSPKEKGLPPGNLVPGGIMGTANDYTPTPNLTGDQGGGNDSGLLKPVGFINIGATAATVMAWTYFPLNSEVPAIPSDASTVAFPGGNPSSHLSLPMGTYTWCYHWELGDVNDDGMIEYAHAIDNRVVILDPSDTDDMDLAEEVVLSVPPGMNEFPGVCQLGDQVIRWGNESVQWRVELLGGIVIRGSVQGVNYFTWTIHGGTFDGVNLYFQATTEDAEGCKGSMEAWWTVTSTSVSSARILNGCGTESLEVHTFGRTE